MLYLSRVRLVNVRCFKKLDIKFPGTDDPSGWTVFVGDNATGKSALLRSIAMGLCDEASAAGLLKESDEGYIRRGQKEARIMIWLREPSSSGRKLRILTRVIRKEGKRGIFSDIVRQTTFPRREEFPWDEIFVSAYGAGRGVAGTGDISVYSSIDAVYNLFNYAEGLQNPELTIRRISGDCAENNGAITDREICRVLQEFMHTGGIRLTNRGIRVDGPWGDGMPLRDLADGYRSSFVWLTDLIGWALAYKPRLRGFDGVRGIVLIDELEQHLHARWQRSVVDDLRRLFRNIQFVVATHSPLIASSVGNYEAEHGSDALYVLEAGEKNQVFVSQHEFMMGWRVDQVLASRAFKYQISSDPEFERVLRIASALAGKRHLTAEEALFLKRTRTRIRDSMLAESSPVEREEEKKVIRVRQERIRKLERRLFPDEHR